MTIDEASAAVKDVPLGAKIQLIKRDGSIVEVNLASHEVRGVPEKNHRTVTVPEMPPALIVSGKMRFGNYRVEIEDIVKIAWVE